MKLLLDTATFLWMVSGDDRLPGRVREALRSPDNEVWLSVISNWEIVVMLVSGDAAIRAYPVRAFWG